MARRFDPASLFERKRFPRVYPSVRAELAAVRDGTKAMAFDAWPPDELDNADHEALLTTALAFGLVVLHRPSLGDEILVCAVRPEHTWRVEALHTLLDVHRTWSDAAEAQQSQLLGYTPAQIAAWIAARRHERLGWGQQTVFAILDDTARAAIARVRGRYIPTAVLDGGLALFFAPGERVIRRDAHRRVGARTLARMAVDWRYFRQTFGTAHGARRVVTVSIEPRGLDALNAALAERVQQLGDDGWRDL